MSTEYNRALTDFDAARESYSGPDHYHSVVVRDKDGKSLVVTGVWRDGKTLTVSVE